MRRIILATLALSGAFLSLAALPAGAVEAGSDVEIGHAEHECIEILEAGGTPDRCQEAPDAILPPLDEILWGLFAFTVLAALFLKFGVPAARAALDNRSAKIAEDLGTAESARAEAEAALVTKQRDLAEARTMADSIIAEARVQAEQLLADMTTRAHADAAELRVRNAEQLTAERDRAVGEMQGQVGALALELAEQVVQSNLDAEMQSRLIDQYIARVGAGLR